MKGILSWEAMVSVCARLARREGGAMDGGRWCPSSIMPAQSPGRRIALDAVVGSCGGDHAHAVFSLFNGMVSLVSDDLSSRRPPHGGGGRFAHASKFSRTFVSHIDPVDKIV
jgi:hypothetical protein